MIGGTAAGERSLGMLIAFGVAFLVLLILSVILYRIQKRAIKAESAGVEQTATEQKEPELYEKTVSGREENKQ